MIWPPNVHWIGMRFSVWLADTIHICRGFTVNQWVSGLFDPTLLAACQLSPSSPSELFYISLIWSIISQAFYTLILAKFCCRILIIGPCFLRHFKAVLQTLPFAHLMLFVLSKNSPHTRPWRGINYRLSAQCWGLSRSDTRTHQTLVTFLGRSFLRKQKQRRWHLGKGRDPQPMVTQKCLCPNYLQLFGALFASCYSYAEHAAALVHAWPQLLLSKHVSVSGKQTP